VSDLFGRQKIIFGGNLIQLLGLAIILTTNSYRLMIAAIIMEGFVATVR